MAQDQKPADNQDQQKKNPKKQADKWALKLSVGAIAKGADFQVPLQASLTEQGRPLPHKELEFSVDGLNRLVDTTDQNGSISTTIEEPLEQSGKKKSIKVRVKGGDGSEKSVEVGIHLPPLQTWNSRTRSQRCPNCESYNWDTINRRCSDCKYPDMPTGGLF